MRVDADDLYRHLLAVHGPQHWWPAETPFEVMLGAVLVQNTAWGNVERAIARLRAADRLSLVRLLELSDGELPALIRPAGTYRVKSARLLALGRWLRDRGGLDALAALPTGDLRRDLLGVHGIGPETADAILLYACERPVFVVDAYARRLFGRWGWTLADWPYERLRAAVEQALPAEAPLLNEFHALIVAHAKAYCRRQPRCADCPLRQGCDFGRANPQLPLS